MKHVIIFFLWLSQIFGTVVALPGFALAQKTATAPKTAHVGVLAYRGIDAAKSRWQPLGHYLTSSVDGWQFKIVPVTLASAPSQIEAKEIDFVITNPGHYVALQEKYRLFALATRERRTAASGPGLLRYGTAIFTSKKANIQSLGDMKNRTLAAVSPDAFGGFQMAWHEFQYQNIDPFKDLKSIRFMGFPQDAIVAAVLAGKVDAGVVRSGLLELLASEGRINLDDFRIIEGNTQLNYPHMVSSQLYPEWPFASLPGSNKQLRENVLTALLATQKKQIQTKFQLRDLWSAPLSYIEVRTLAHSYRGRNASDGLFAGNTVGNLNLIGTLLALSFLGFLLIYLVMGRRDHSVAASGDTSQSQVAVDQKTTEIMSRFDSLTRREREILCMICEGLSSKAVADKLGISPKTVEYHRSNLLQKTQAGTTPHLVQLAARLGFD